MTEREILIEKYVAAVLRKIPQLLASVGAVTLVFMLIEYHHVKVGRPAEAWTVAKLHTEPSGGKPIKRADSIVSLVFTTIFLTVLCAAPEFLGAWVKEADESFRGISIFHMKTFCQILPWFILAFGMKMVRDVVILCVPRYTPGVCGDLYHRNTEFSGNRVCDDDPSGFQPYLCTGD